MKTALVAGASGLIGGQLLGLLLKDDYYAQVTAISRRPLPIDNSKLQNCIADLNTFESFQEMFSVDDVFCCLGTTMTKAKTKEAFRKVDYDYPLTVARISKQKGATQFLLVSALGANSSSSIFYNRVKGEVEAAIAGIGFRSYHIFRPSLLLGPRKEERKTEDAAKWVYKALGFIIPQRLKAIESIKVARAMVTLAKKEENGNFVH